MTKHYTVLNMFDNQGTWTYLVEERKTWGDCRYTRTLNFEDDFKYFILIETTDVDIQAKAFDGIDELKGIPFLIYEFETEDEALDFIKRGCETFRRGYEV